MSTSACPYVVVSKAASPKPDTADAGSPMFDGSVATHLLLDSPGEL